MSNNIRNVFISHIHEDDDGIAKIKDLLARHGMIARNSSVTSDRPNAAHSENYIKSGILAPRIDWASVLVVYVSPESRHSWWVKWEIEYAHKQEKRIVGVWERGKKGCDLPEALNRHAHAIVGWNGEHLIDAIEGRFNGRPPVANAWESEIPDWLIFAGLFIGAGYVMHKFMQAQSGRQSRVYPRLSYRPRRYYDGLH